MQSKTAFRVYTKILAPILLTYAPIWLKINANSNCSPRDLNAAFITLRFLLNPIYSDFHAVNSLEIIGRSEEKPL